MTAEDVLVATATSIPAVDRYQWGTSYAQQPFAVAQSDDRLSSSARRSAGSGLAIAITGRAWSAVG